MSGKLNGTCSICNKEVHYVDSILHLIGKKMGMYGVGNFAEFPVIYRNQLWICLDCKKDKKMIIKKIIEQLKFELT